ncbi:unnamed protein product, partial [Ilex paraguariensis]
YKTGSGGEEGREHQGPSPKATNMVVEWSQCHETKGGANEFSQRTNPMKLTDPARLDLCTTTVEEG